MCCDKKMSFSESYSYTTFEGARLLKQLNGGGAFPPAAPPLLRRTTSDTATEVDGGRILMPSSALERLSRLFSESLPSPLTFELSAGSAKCYVGVAEFSAPADHIVLTEAIIDSLRE